MKRKWFSYIFRLSSASLRNMKFILLILIPTLLLKHICEAQVITTTSTIAISTTETEMSTQLVLGFCISQLDGPCRRKKQHYYQPYYPSSYGQIQSRNEDAFLYSPSFVEKYVFWSIFSTSRNLKIQSFTIFYSD